MGDVDAGLLAVEAGGGAPSGASDLGSRGASSTTSSTVQPTSRAQPAAGSEEAQTAIVDEVPLEEQGGTSLVPVQINGAITLDFVVDSGAADVQIPLDVFRTLVRTGTIVTSDLIGEQTYTLADGSTEDEPRFVLRELKVGTGIFRNVLASVSPASGALLLGQSFLSRFAEWTFDNRHHMLRLAERAAERPHRAPPGASGGAGPAAPATAAGTGKDEAPSQSDVARIALLNEQVAALRQQLATLSAALEISEEEDIAKGAEIADLGRRLNATLAGKAQPIELYRNEFFGELREALANQPGIRVVGDRFVLQNEVLFPIGSADLTPEGKLRIIEVALSLQEIARKIPPGLHWILEVQGYTDSTPIDTPRFPSHRELSARRAINVVELLIQQGIPPDRLVPVGFGDTHPLDAADTPDAYAKNRRIEFRLGTY